MPRRLSMTPAAIRQRERRAMQRAVPTPTYIPIEPLMQKPIAIRPLLRSIYGKPPGAPKALHRKELAGLNDQQKKCAALVESSGMYKVHKKKRAAPRTQAQLDGLARGRAKSGRGIRFGEMISGMPEPGAFTPPVLPVPTLMGV